MESTSVVYTLRAKPGNGGSQGTDQESCLWPIKLDSKAKDQAEQLFKAVEAGDIYEIQTTIAAFTAVSDKHEGIVDVRRCPESNEFPLFVAAGVGRAEVVQCLLDSGCNPCALTDTEESALDAAVVLGHTEVVQILLKTSCSAIAHKRNAEGLTMLDEILDDILRERRSSKDSLVDIALLLFESGVMPSGINFLHLADSAEGIPPRLLPWLEALERPEQLEVLSRMHDMIIERETVQKDTTRSPRTSPNKKRTVSPQKDRRTSNKDGPTLEPHPPAAKTF